MDEQLEAKITAGAIRIYDYIPFVLIIFAMGDVIAMINDPSWTWAAWALVCVLVALLLPPRTS